MMRNTRARPSGRRLWWVAGTLALIAGTVLAIVWLRPVPPARGISALGSDPTVAQDVNTLLGQRAATFSLPDISGKRHTITPGGGRPLVVISHMGFY